MKRLLPILALLLTAHSASAVEVKVQYRLTGLFQPDRADDLRRQAGTFTIHEGNTPAEIRLAGVDYEQAVVTFAYDADAKPFRSARPEQMRERINNLLRNASHGTFQLFPLSGLPPEQLVRERIPVAGLDCKGCAYGAYRAIATIDGVERAVVSFKEGHVTAWIDRTKTSRKALVAALRKAQVDVSDAETAADQK